MKKFVTLSILATLALPAMADDSQAGFWFGAGAAATITDNCDFCDTSGHVLELGYDFNRVVSMELKMGGTSYDSLGGDLDFTYVGLNAGGDFGTTWVKLYGKAGLLSAEESVTGYGVSDNSLAYGIGVRFTPAADQRGFYIKLESLRSKFDDLEYSAGTFTLGFKI